MYAAVKHLLPNPRELQCIVIMAADVKAKTVFTKNTSEPLSFCDLIIPQNPQKVNRFLERVFDFVSLHKNICFPFVKLYKMY